MINRSQQRILKLKLVSLWKPFSQWKLISLGRGFFDFQFSSTEDKRPRLGLLVHGIYSYPNGPPISIPGRSCNLMF
ncbi:hypothetical protein A2U01_0044517, partial [Trifolium medium]|nr:hypothetical protein [Trifolium medium]